MSKNSTSWLTRANRAIDAAGKPTRGFVREVCNYIFEFTNRALVVGGLFFLATKANNVAVTWGAIGLTVVLFVSLMVTVYDLFGWSREFADKPTTGWWTGTAASFGVLAIIGAMYLGFQIAQAVVLALASGVGTS